MWDDYRFVATVTTNEEGYASNAVEHKYHYDKTFCDGHPAPAFVEVPEEEEDEEGEVTNQDEIDEAKEENRRLASGWLECFDACDETASAGTYEGVHFHWLMSEVSQEKSLPLHQAAARRKHSECRTDQFGIRGGFLCEFWL